MPATDDSQDGVARLPELLIKKEPTIGQMKPGDIGYASTMALSADHERRCFLWTKAPVTQKPNPLLLRIERRGDGYHVEIPEGQKYEPGASVYRKEDSSPVRSIRVRDGDH